MILSTVFFKYSGLYIEITKATHTYLQAPFVSVKVSILYIFLILLIRLFDCDEAK